MQKRVYPIGSFSGTWRDDFRNAIPELSFDDPRDHDQSAVAKLDFSDMNSAMDCPIAIVYLENEKRAGTMSYAELGASRAKGNCIMAIDKNKKEDSLIKKIASHYYTDQDRAIEFLKKGEFRDDKNLPINYQNKTNLTTPYNSILFTGDLEEMAQLIEELSSKKKTHTRPTHEEIQNFTQNFDLVVVNFRAGDLLNKYGLYHMGIAYATGVPIIMLEGNKIPYFPLPGLARRTFVGNEKFDMARDYLTRLSSQHINDEAKVCYELFKKYNTA